MTLKQGGNVLLLDEPTNDLDVETLRFSLENGCSSSPAVPVSRVHAGTRSGRDTHARLEGRLEPGQKWFWFEGNFESYEKNKVERLGLRRGARRTPSPTASSPREYPGRPTWRASRPGWQMRWSDMDAYGARQQLRRYLTYLEEARVDVPVRAAQRVDQVAAGILVAASDIKYRKPLLAGTAPVPIDVWVTKIGAAYFYLGYEVPERGRGRLRHGVVHDGAVK